MRPQRCPVCGELFPRSALYCDQDGVELVAAGGGRRRWVLWTAAAAGAVVLVLLAAPALLARYLAPRVDVAVEGVRFPAAAVGAGGGAGEKSGGGKTGERQADEGRADEGLLGGLLGGLGDLAARVIAPQQMAVELRVVNRTPLPLRLRSARYEVRVSGQAVGGGDWQPPPGSDAWAPGERLTATLVVTPTPEGALAIAAALLAGEAPEVTVDGRLAVALFGADFEVPFHVRRIDARFDEV